MAGCNLTAIFGAAIFGAASFGALFNSEANSCLRVVGVAGLVITGFGDVFAAGDG